MYSYWYKDFLELTSGTLNYHALAVHNEDFIKSGTDELESRLWQKSSRRGEHTSVQA